MTLQIDLENVREAARAFKGLTLGELSKRLRVIARVGLTTKHLEEEFRKIAHARIKLDTGRTTYDRDRNRWWERL